MSATKWTPGPWWLGESQGGTLYVYSPSSTQPLKPHVKVPKRGTRLMCANARLMSTAPELFNELSAVEWGHNDNGVQCCPRCGSGRPDHYEGCGLRAALLKAGGEA